MATKPTVLFLVETPGQFVELYRFADLLAATRPAHLLFLVYECQPATAQIVQSIREMGGECLNIALPSQEEMRRRTLAATPGALRAVLRFFRDALRPLVVAFGFRRMLRSRRVDLVVVAEDNVGGRSRALVATASRIGIPVLLLPYTIVNPDEAARFLRRFASHQVRRLDQRLFAWMRPAWAREYKGMPLLRLPVSRALVIELSGLAPAEPWIDNKGPAIVPVESRAMMRHYRNLGFSEDRLSLTGNLSDRMLEAALRERKQRVSDLRARFELGDEPLLLCALPPNQFIGGIAASEFPDFEALMNAWVSALQAVADRFAIVVRPHPRLADAALEPFRRAGIAISWDDTASLVPLCDLYVASASATVRWAIACGRPVINYDVYAYDLADYEGVAGVIGISSLAEFRAVLVELAQSPERLAALAAAQARVAPEWGLLDGRSGERIMALADRLLAMRHQVHIRSAHMTQTGHLQERRAVRVDPRDDNP